MAPSNDAKSQIKATAQCPPYVRRCTSDACSMGWSSLVRPVVDKGE